MFPATSCTTTSPTTISPLLVTCLILLLTAPQAPGQERREKPDRFYIGGVLSSASTARAFTMEAQVRPLLSQLNTIEHYISQLSKPINGEKINAGANKRLMMVKQDKVKLNQFQSDNSCNGLLV